MTSPQGIGGVAAQARTSRGEALQDIDTLGQVIASLEQHEQAGLPAYQEGRALRGFLTLRLLDEQRRQRR